MRLKDYGRDQKKRKAHIKQSELLLAEVDVSKTKLRRLELGTISLDILYFFSFKRAFYFH
jgi:hypothetical protein